MSLRGALLGLLHAEPMSGYELDQILDETYGYVWTAPHSQIYQALRQMEREGLVTAQVHRTGDRERREYSLTSEGERELRQWARSPVRYTGERDPAHLKAAMMDMIPLDRAEEHFLAHAAYFRERLATWEGRIEAIRSGSSRILQARLRHRPPEEHEALIAFKLHSYEGSAARARAEIAWAEEGLAMVARLRRETNAEAGLAPSGGRAGGIGRAPSP